MKLLRRQPKPEPEDDDDLAPPFGVHPLIDLMAMQHYLIKQQRDIWRALASNAKHNILMARLWMLVAAGFLISSGLSIWSSLCRLFTHC